MFSPKPILRTVAAACVCAPLFVQAGTPVKLTCAPGATSGVADISTQVATWDTIKNRVPVATTAAAPNTAWSTAPGQSVWLGDGASNDPQEPIDFSVMLDASDPAVVANSARFDFSYLVDNEVQDITFESNAIGAINLPLGTQQQPAFASLTTVGSAQNPVPGTPGLFARDASNKLTFRTLNTFGPWGLAVDGRVHFDCSAAGPVTSVPANAPWALVSLSGAMLAGVALLRRRRKVGA